MPVHIPTADDRDRAAGLAEDRFVPVYLGELTYQPPFELVDTTLAYRGRTVYWHV